MHAKIAHVTIALRNFIIDPPEFKFDIKVELQETPPIGGGSAKSDDTHLRTTVVYSACYLSPVPQMSVQALPVRMGALVCAT